MRLVPLEVPRELFAVHVHPHLEIETSGARTVLGDRVLLSDAVVQWGNTAALVAGLFREDWELIGRSVQDRIAEPLRAPAVPGFAGVKEAALNAGALAASLSGSGPSLFALCRGRERAEAVGTAMVEAFWSQAKLEADLLVSPGQAPGARGMDPDRADAPGANDTPDASEAGRDPSGPMDSDPPSLRDS
jgi:homoserine kinase